ncbi:MAG TPA: hypothetical protein VGQ82_11825 [Chthoniobacterales bacterium]|nr:hypothetical protein [Chthoniobacterales bacterium]
MPARKTLPHDVPTWLDPSHEIYFITICCARRGVNQLANPKPGNLLLETVRYRNDTTLWYAHLALVMPDHIHLLLTFPQTAVSIRRVISKWKDWTAKSGAIVWQRDFFEHRLREEESFREKSDYILANPLRAGLVQRNEEWPYVFRGEMA